MTDLIPTEIIESFFYELREKGIPHILLRNLNHELPNKLKLGKDIDILLHKKNRLDIISLFKRRGMKYRHHSRAYLYGMNPFDYYIDSVQDFAVDVSYQMACQSPNDGEWVPLDIHLQEMTWSTRLLTPNSPWESTLAPQVEIIHLVCRSIFDKRHFSKSYIKRIEELKNKCNFNELTKSFEFIFFKFTPPLMKMINNREYNKLPNRYLKFSDY